MSASARLGGFGAVLVAVFGLAVVVGGLVGPTPSKEHETVDEESMVSVGEGVVAASDGYRLSPAVNTLPASGGGFRFRIEGPDGTPITRFVATHDRRLHLIVVNRELTDYHHLHPALAADGTWSAEIPAVSPGSYRAVADFRVAEGPALSLGVDLAVAGDYRPITPPGPSRTATVDGYVVELETEHGDGGEIEVEMTVRKDGGRVAVQPYLGAAGHLVAMRTSDLHYAHVHPLGHSAATVRFAATLPSAGRYRLFFDFKHDDTVHTAAFTFDQDTVSGAPSMGH